MSTAVCYRGPVVQITISEAESQGSLVRILRSLISFSFFYLFHYYFFVSISFHLFIIIIIFFSLCILIMIFSLLVRGVRVGRLCWVGQEPAVLAAEGGWRLFGIISRVIVNWLAIVRP